MTSASTVFVVDDDPGIRKSLTLVMEAAGLTVRSFPSAEDFLADHAGQAGGNAGSAGCVVLDLSMPGMNGVELLETLRNRGVELPVIVVTGTGTVGTAVRSLKLGAIDFLEKPADPRDVLAKVQRALAEDARRRTATAEVDAIRARFRDLTARERELLRYVIAGLANKQIAAEMGISIKTVENHRANLMDKTGALNGADLVRMSMIAGETGDAPADPNQPAQA